MKTCDVWCQDRAEKSHVQKQALMSSPALKGRAW